MKKSIKIAALMVAAVATMVACNNNTPAEEELDTIEEATEIVVEEPTVDSEEVAVAEDVATEEKTVVDNTKKQTGIDATNKPAASEFKGELKENDANPAKKQTLSKPSAANMVKNVKKVE